jgi:hypothetical protein
VDAELMRAAIVFLVLAAQVARADDPPTQPQPWAVGVGEPEKATARQHLDAGNQLFLANKYTEALEAYRHALEAWNHPAIRFNIVRCLILLKRPLEASEDLELALRYGAAPFDASIYREALAYQTLLASEIGELEIECHQDGVQITVDGKPLPPCPGTHVTRLIPDRHQVVATKAGFLTHTARVPVLGGKREHLTITLDPASKAARIVHRWKTWIPWTTFGAGLVVAGLGGLLELEARQNLASYNEQEDNACRRGCPPGQLSTDLRERALLEDKIAVGLIAAGAAGAAVGVAMVYLNRGRVVHDAPAVEVVPRPGGAVVTVGGRF